MVDITAQLTTEDPLNKVFKDHQVDTIQKDNKRIAIIRTSDRVLYKQCRRRWGWGSHLRHNLGPKQNASALWMGTGFHFALEDFHGYNKFEHPKVAFDAFVEAQKKFYKAKNQVWQDKFPDDWEELVELVHGMLDWYMIWLQKRSASLLKTLWIDGVPQVEVNFRFRIPWESGRFGYDEVYYSGTIDRVCIDDEGLIWPLDYKTAKAIEIMHFMTDPQIGAYMWATPHLYNYPVGGFKYMQFRKSVPEPPAILARGGVSVNQMAKSRTNHHFYREALIKEFGTVENSTPENQAYLKDLLFQEDENKDAYIQIDSVNRNERMGQSEGTKILMEVEEMLNPDLPLYPNPTRLCSHWKYGCPFLSACTSLDDGSDWKTELEMTTEPREKGYDSWRKFLVYPGEEPIEEPKQDTSWLDV